MLLFIQLLIGISTSLYLPAIGTAGLLLASVSGNNLVPDPPPNITATVEFVIVSISVNFRVGKKISCQKKVLSVTSR